MRRFVPIDHIISV